MIISILIIQWTQFYFNSQEFSFEAICIDEFKGNAGGAKYQCIIVDPMKKHTIEILKDRRQDVLIEYF